jgi:DNA repair exonuclease SbcCD nuclease subunit
MDELTIVAIADTHIGAEKHYCTPEEWDAPMLEALAYARASDAILLIAGDIWDKRSPTPAQYLRARELLDYGIACVGNHDIGVGKTSVPASWSWRERVAVPPVSTVEMRGLQIVMLPWPRPVDYLTADEISAYPMEQRIVLTRDRVMEALRREVAALDPALPAVLLGHAMVSFGPARVDGPGLQLLGKDVVLDAHDLDELALQALYLGHVHRRMGPYVGSTQPTDWGEADDVKAFTVTRLREPTWTAEHETVPYKSSRRLLLIEGRWPEYDSNPAWVKGLEGVDVVRAEFTIAEGQAFPAANIRKRLEATGVIVESVSARVIGERKRRVENVEGLDLTQPAVAAQAWTEQRGLSEKLANTVVERINSHDIAATDAARN